MGRHNLRVRGRNEPIEFQGSRRTRRKCTLRKEHDVIVTQLRSSPKKPHPMVRDVDPFIQNGRRSLGKFLGCVIASMYAEGKPVGVFLKKPHCARVRSAPVPRDAGNRCGKVVLVHQVQSLLIFQEAIAWL